MKEYKNYEGGILTANLNRALKNIGSYKKAKNKADKLKQKNALKNYMKAFEAAKKVSLRPVKGRKPLKK